MTDTGKNGRLRCACCGSYTMESGGEYDICPVCFWEADAVQEKDPSYAGGANTLSLNECRENYLRFGAVEERFIKYVRDPLPEETADE